MSESVFIKGRNGEGNVFVTTEKLMQGLESLLRQGKVGEAADIYSRCQEDIGYILINRVKTDPQMLKLVANLFYRARDYEKAAVCCENLEEYAKAAQLYEHADDYQSAAEMYARVENYEKAAEMFERNQNYRQAAELYLKVKNFARAAACYEQAVDYFVAGKLYHDLGKYRKSMELLQKVQAEDDSFAQATMLIGDILARHGYLDLAIKKLLNVIKGRPVGKDTVDLYYQLAEFHTKKGNPQVAANIYQQIIDFDVSYRDAADKLAALKKDFEAAPDIKDKPDTTQPYFSGTDEEARQQVVGVMEGFDFLRKIPLFEDMPLSHMKAFYNVCEDRLFEPGQIIIEQGRPGVALYVIREGTVAVRRKEGDTSKEVARLGPGEYFGEMSLVDEAPTSAQVVAVEKTRAFEISREHFLRFLQANDRFAVRVLRVFVRTLCQRLRDTTARLAGGKES